MGCTTGFVRLGGIAGLIVTLIGAIVNIFLVARGPVGGVWIAATGSVANAAEVVVVWQADSLTGQSQLAAAVWGMNIATFIALLIPWATFTLGFSVAGRASGVFPAWMLGLGLLITATGLIGAMGTRSVMVGGFAEPVAVAAYSLT